jgi:hypothetical protein
MGKEYFVYPGGALDYSEAKETRDLLLSMGRKAKVIIADGRWNVKAEASAYNGTRRFCHRRAD